LDLLRVDIDELESLAMHPLDAIDRRVEDMGFGPRFGQRVEMVAGVPESAVDEAGDEGRLIGCRFTGSDEVCRRLHGSGQAGFGRPAKGFGIQSVAGQRVSVILSRRRRCRAPIN
jgi:hypothetical protein